MTDHPDTLASPSALAKLFHETYERLAPEFGYETREASRTDWADVPLQNKALMIAVAGKILAPLRRELADANKRADEAQLRSIEARNPGIDMDEVRAALAAHDQQSGDEWEMRVTLEEARSPDVSDAPEPRKPWPQAMIEAGYFKAAGGPATPEGGQPDPCRICQDRGWVWEGDATRGEGTPAECPACEGGQPDTDDERCPGGDACRCNEVEPEGGWPISLLDEDELRDRVRRLERELAKAREQAEEWEKIAADYRRGTVTVTDGMLDDWIAALRSGNAIVFGPPQANGLADRLAEARSHGEARSFKDEVAESIWQRHADGWHAVMHEIIEPPCWNRAGYATEPLTPEQVAWLKGEPVRATADQQETDGGAGEMIRQVTAENVDQDAVNRGFRP